MASAIFLQVKSVGVQVATCREPAETALQGPGKQ